MRSVFFFSFENSNGGPFKSVATLTEATAQCERSSKTYRPSWSQSPIQAVDTRSTSFNSSTCPSPAAGLQPQFFSLIKTPGSCFAQVYFSGVCFFPLSPLDGVQKLFAWRERNLSRTNAQIQGQEGGGGWRCKGAWGGGGRGDGWGSGSRGEAETRGSGSDVRERGARQNILFKWHGNTREAGLEAIGRNSGAVRSPDQ